jgi:hypothetical protein
VCSEAVGEAAIAASFVVTSALGASFVFWYWADRGLDSVAVVRAVLFVAIIAVVHVVALRAYAAQHSPATQSVAAENSSTVSPPPTGLLSTVSPMYKSALKLATLQQVVLLNLSSLLLDFGQTFRVCAVAAIVHWITIAIIVARRPLSPTGLDLGIIRWGFIPMFIVVGRLAPFVRSFVDH